MVCGSSPSIRPCRFFQSLGLTPTARTAIRTWPGPGCGSGRSTICRTSGPPNWLKRTAFIIRSDLDASVPPARILSCEATDQQADGTDGAMAAARFLGRRGGTFGPMTLSALTPGLSSDVDDLDSGHGVVIRILSHDGNMMGNGRGRDPAVVDRHLPACRAKSRYQQCPSLGDGLVGGQRLEPLSEQIG